MLSDVAVVARRDLDLLAHVVCECGQVKERGEHAIVSLARKQGKETHRHAQRRDARVCENGLGLGARAEPPFPQESERRIDGVPLCRKTRPALVGHEPDRAPPRRQPQIGIVLPEDEPVLRAARHHAVGLLRPLRHEVIDEDADVAVTAPQDQRLLPGNAACGIDARDQALRRRLLVAARPV